MLHIHQKPLFSTQIYYKKLQNKSEKKFILDLKKEAYQIQKADYFGQDWSSKNYKNGYTSYGSSKTGFDRLHSMSSTFKNLEKQIDRHIKKYTQLLDLDLQSHDLKMTHCWVNIMGKTAQHTSHAHPLSVISGTFYVDIPKGSSPLKFEDPRMGLFMNSPGIKAAAKLQNQRYIEIQPASGYLVLFESWLKHEVPLHVAKKDRISVSFNYGWN